MDVVISRDDIIDYVIVTTIVSQRVLIYLKGKKVYFCVKYYQKGDGNCLTDSVSSFYLCESERDYENMNMKMVQEFIQKKIDEAK